MLKEIENLIPHRSPFLFVDNILIANEKEVVGTKIFEKVNNPMLTGSFPEYDFVPGMILVESMAQCGGAGIKKAGLADGFFGLVSMSEVVFIKALPYGQAVQYKIENIRVSNRLIKQSGIAYFSDVPVVKATWVCARID